MRTKKLKDKIQELEKNNQYLNHLLAGRNEAYITLQQRQEKLTAELNAEKEKYASLLEKYIAMMERALGNHD